MEKITMRNIIIIEPWADSRSCDVRPYRSGDESRIASGAVSTRELPLDGAWSLVPEYEWGMQTTVCYARFIAGEERVQVVKAHGLNEALDLDEHGNLWYSLYNEVEGAWVNEIVGLRWGD